MGLPKLNARRSRAGLQAGKGEDVAFSRACRWLPRSTVTAAVEMTVKEGGGRGRWRGGRGRECRGSQRDGRVR